MGAGGSDLELTGDFFNLSCNSIPDSLLELSLSLSELITVAVQFVMGIPSLRFGTFFVFSEFWVCFLRST